MGQKTSFQGQKRHFRVKKLHFNSFSAIFLQFSQTPLYVPKIAYEFTVFTSDLRSAGTDSDIFVRLYGTDGVRSEQLSLCRDKTERKKRFERAAKDVFVLEMEDIGPTIEKMRIGHDSKGYGAGWHCDKVLIRRLAQSMPEDLDNLYDFQDRQQNIQNTQTWEFLVNRWFAKDEDDKQIVREFVPSNIFEEIVDKEGRKSQRSLTEQLASSLTAQIYKIAIKTGDKSGAGTDANVFCTVFGEKGDSGEHKLSKSAEHRDKFERGQIDTGWFFFWNVRFGVRKVRFSV